jgi:hypothetical protein
MMKTNRQARFTAVGVGYYKGLNDLRLLFAFCALQVYRPAGTYCIFVFSQRPPPLHDATAFSGPGPPHYRGFAIIFI